MRCALGSEGGQRWTEHVPFTASTARRGDAGAKRREVRADCSGVADGMTRFIGQVVLVTGAAHGIGEAIARRFHAEGARLITLDVDDRGLEKLAGELAGTERIACDLSQHEAIATAMRYVEATYGCVDVLINNAGIAESRHLLEADYEHWRRLFAINLDAQFLISRALAPLMRAKQAGVIVNVASIQALLSEPCSSAYGATKGAIAAFTRGLAIDLAPVGVRVNAIAPGFIQTRMSLNAAGVDETTTKDFQDWYVRRRKIPMARAGLPAEVAAVAAFLASVDASYMTGQMLVVDGGLTITF